MANEGIVNRTFVTAHLLTGRIDLAEKATLEAIDAWKADIESAEAIFGHGVAAALRKRKRRPASGLSVENGTHSYLPAELQAILELRPALRRAFVLRLLAGFSREDYGELLWCPPERVDRDAWMTAGLLPSFQKVNTRGECMEHQEVDQSKLDQVAYDFWLQRGCPMGSPEEDWFRAEQKLRRGALDRKSPAVEAPIAATAVEA